MLDAKVKKIDTTEVRTYALATLCYELRDRFIAGEKAEPIASRWKNTQEFANYRRRMDNFETEMVVMASDCNATIQAGIKQKKIERFEEYFKIRTIGA